MSNPDNVKIFIYYQVIVCIVLIFQSKTSPPTVDQWNEGILYEQIYTQIIFTDSLVFTWKNYVINYRDIQTIAKGEWLNDKCNLHIITFPVLN